MSIRVMTAVWDHGPEDQGELLVLLALADFADDSGYCWPAMASVAEKARMSERNARRIIRKLEDRGLLMVEENRGRNATNRYRVMPAEKKPDNVSGFQKTGHLRNENRTFEARKPDIQSTKPDTVVSAEPSRTIIEPSKNHQDARDGFDEFWTEVPKKVAKGAARKAYAAALKKADHNTLMAGIRRYAEERSGKDPTYTAHPATWLNAERWADKPDQRPASFHDNFEEAFNALELREPRRLDSAGAERLPSPVQDARTPGQRNRAEADQADGGRYQQETARILERFGSGRAIG